MSYIVDCHPDYVFEYASEAEAFQRSVCSFFEFRRPKVVRVYHLPTVFFQWVEDGKKKTCWDGEGLSPKGGAVLQHIRSWEVNFEERYASLAEAQFANDFWGLGKEIKPCSGEPTDCILWTEADGSYTFSSEGKVPPFSPTNRANHFKWCFTSIENKVKGDVSDLAPYTEEVYETKEPSTLPWFAAILATGVLAGLIGGGAKKETQVRVPKVPLKRDLQEEDFLQDPLESARSKA